MISFISTVNCSSDIHMSLIINSTFCPQCFFFSFFPLILSNTYTIFMIDIKHFYRPSVGQEVNSGVEEVDDNLQADLTQLNTGKDTAPSDMAAASKEAPKDVPITVAKAARSDDSIFTLLYSIAKKVSIVGAIYLVGYMNWSVAWLITPVILAVTREYWNKTNETRRAIAKASATANEKDVILARINDLPAWVVKYFVLFKK